MKMITAWLAVASLGLLVSASVGAQEAEMPQPADDQADVWAVVEQQWDADERGDRKWGDEFLADDFSGWTKGTPAPRGKESTIRWDRFAEQLGKPLEHELYPLAIVVEGDVAVAHYLYTQAYENKGGEIEMNSGRYTDVLVRTESGWKFLAWHGGDD